MPDPRYPGAIWNPGINAGYAAGRTTMESAVCHYTVGYNSTPIGLQGYLHFLISRDGTVQQFAEADATCWHAGSPWNARGPGLEVEHYDEPEIFTPEAEHATALLVQWLEDEWGIPAEFYDGDRRVSWHGFITHRSLIQTGGYHSDFWPYLPTVAPSPGPPALPEEDDDMPTIIKDNSAPQRTLLVTEDEVYEVSELTAGNVVCTKEQADYIINDIRARAKKP